LLGHCDYSLLDYWLIEGTVSVTAEWITFTAINTITDLSRTGSYGRVKKTTLTLAICTAVCNASWMLGKCVMAQIAHNRLLWDCTKLLNCHFAGCQKIGGVSCLCHCRISYVKLVVSLINAILIYTAYILYASRARDVTV
jgi:hypothetical protein